MSGTTPVNFQEDLMAEPLRRDPFFDFLFAPLFERRATLHSARSEEPYVAPGDVPHKHKCATKDCPGEWEHTPKQAWAQGRWESHTCTLCHQVQFEPTEGEHDVFG